MPRSTLTRANRATAAELEPRRRVARLWKKLAHGTDVQALHEACLNGDLDDVTKLVKRGVSAVAIGATGMQPIHALIHGNQKFTKLNILNFLVHDCNVDVNAVDNCGMTPLHYACSNIIDSSVVSALLDKGADLKLKTRSNQSALEILYSQGFNKCIIFIDSRSSFELLKILIDYDTIHYGPSSLSDRTKLDDLTNLPDYSKTLLASCTKPLDTTDEQTRDWLVQTWFYVIQSDDPYVLLDFYSVHGLMGDTNSAWIDFYSLDCEELFDVFTRMTDNDYSLPSLIRRAFVDISEPKLLFLTIFSKFTHMKESSPMTFVDATLHEGNYLSRPFYMDMVFIALLCGRHRIVKFLLQTTQFDVIPTSLTSALITRHISKHIQTMPEVNEKLEVFAKAAEAVAIDALNRTFLKDNSRNKKVTVDYLTTPLQRFGHKQIVDITASAGCQRFLTTVASQRALSKRWYSRAVYGLPTWQRWSVSFCPPLSMLFVDMEMNTLQSRKSQNIEDAPMFSLIRGNDTNYLSDKKGRLRILRDLASRPAFKFFHHTIALMVMLFFLAYTILRKFYFHISVVEYVFWTFFLGFLAEEVRELYIHVTDRRILRYFGSKRNYIDIAGLIFGTIAFCVRITVSSNVAENSKSEAYHPTLYGARALLAATFLINFMRLLAVVRVYKNIGPKVKMIQRMFFLDFLPMLLIILIFVVSFGVVFESLLNPNGWTDEEKFLRSMQVFRNILRRSVYGMFAPDSQVDSIQGDNCHSEQNCPNPWGADLVIDFALILYGVIVSVLLMNLVIALFSNTINKIAEDETQHWLADRYYMVEEYKMRSLLPPPLNLFIFWLPCLQKCPCTSDKKRQLTTRKYEIKLTNYFIVQAIALQHKRLTLGEQSISEGSVSHTENNHYFPEYDRNMSNNFLMRLENCEKSITTLRENMASRKTYDNPATA